MTATAQWQSAPQAPVRVSDGDRERTVGLLRDAWLAGRLDEDELEDRAREAFEARYVTDLWHAVRELPLPSTAAPALRKRRGAAAWSLALSCSGAAILMLSFGLGFLLALPLTATGWGLGRGVRRDPLAEQSGAARAGEIVGLLATLCGCLAFAGCATAIVAAN